jgi:transcriptional regulator with XRE-family HTH domain
MRSSVLDIVKMRRLREDAGLTVTEAARRAGWKDRRRWHAIESGAKKDISLKTLDRIADALRVEAKDLLKSCDRERRSERLDFTSPRLASAIRSRAT